MWFWNKITKSDIGKEFGDDVSDKLFSSKDRIIKTCGVLILPMIYAFTCIFAFWNPVGAIGKTPTAIVNQDQKSLIIGLPDDPFSDPIAVNVKAPVAYKDNTHTELKYFETAYDSNGILQIEGLEWEDFLEHEATVNGVLFSNVDIKAGTLGSAVDATLISKSKVVSVMDYFITNAWMINKNNSLGYDALNNRFFMDVSSKVRMTNIAYVSRDPSLTCTASTDPDKYATYDTTTNIWNVKNSDYFLQLDIPTHFSATIIDVLDAAVNNVLLTPQFAALLKGTINSYTTYAKSFFIGEIIDQMSPMVMGSLISTIIAGIPTNTDINPNDFIHTDVPNGQFNNYGIGIGEMFLCVGLWVGAFGMTTVMKRDKKHAKLKSWKWYISKGLTLSTLSVAQAVLLTLSVGCLGWFALGPTFLLIALFMIFCGLIFTQIIQALWFMFRDHTKGSILMIAYLVLNIAAGGGTFPVFSQNIIFRIISYLMPFRYAIQAEGAMIYGLGAGVNIGNNAWYIISRCLILLVFLIFFMGVGILFARKRNKEILYGTANKAHMSYVLNELKHYHYLDENGQVDWKKLPNEEQPKWKAACNEFFPEDNKFLWFKKKGTSSVQDIGTE